MLHTLLDRFPALISCKESIEQALATLIQTYENGGKVLLCGNGGSAADSDHIVGELMKGFMLKRPVTDERIPAELRKYLQGGLPAISLPSQSAVLSAFINDVEPSMMYAQLVYGYATEKDTVIGISTSGNSENIVNAMTVAKAVGANTIALTGAMGGKLKEFCQHTICVPETETYKIQEYHLPVYHYLCAALEDHFFNN